MTTKSLDDRAREAAELLLEGRAGDELDGDLPFSALGHEGQINAIAFMAAALAKDFARDALAQVFRINDESTTWGLDPDDVYAQIETADFARPLVGCGCCADRYYPGADCKAKAAKVIADFSAAAIDAAAKGEP
jgi:hypothetical protein